MSTIVRCFFDETARLRDGCLQIKPFWLCLGDRYTDSFLGAAVGHFCFVGDARTLVVLSDF